MSQPIDDAEAIAFVTYQVRPLANAMSRVLRAMKSLRLRYDAKGLDAKFPADSAAIVADAVPGNTPLSGADIRNFMASLDGVIAGTEANNGAVAGIVAKISDLAD